MTDQHFAQPLDGDGIRETLAMNVASFADPQMIADQQGRDAEALYVIPAGYKVERVDLTGHHPGPARKTGAVHVRDADSFKAFVARHAVPEHTTIYANPAQATLTAVLNGDSDVATGWGDHRCIVTMQTTEAWDRWARVNGEWLTQQDFAEHVEDSLPDFAEPSAAHMLELAQTFSATTNADFESANRLSTGERQIVWKETVAARAGQRGTLDVPEQFTIGIAPYKGGPAYRVNVRLRFRVNSGDLRLMVKVERMDEAAETAFTEAVGSTHTFLEQFVPGLMTVNGTRR